MKKLFCIILLTALLLTLSASFAYADNTPVRGDATGDGFVDALDAVRLKRYFAELDPLTLDSDVEVSPGADANGDGKITTLDLIRIKMIIAAAGPLGDRTARIVYQAGQTSVTEYITSVDLRAKAVEYMHRMANVEWTLKSDTTINFSHISPRLIYYPGNVYLGMIYNWSVYSNLENFEDIVAKGPYSNPGATTGNTPGNTCATAIRAAWQTISPRLEYSYTIDMMPGVRANNVIPVGNVPWEKYNGTASVKGNTQSSVMGLMTMNEVYEAYALTKPGDALMRQKGESGHAMMITGNTVVVRKADGNVDGRNSKIIISEQNADPRERDGKLSTWKYDHTYDFEYLRMQGYLPVSMPELRDNRTEKPYFILSGKLSDATASQLIAGFYNQNLKSNYRITDVDIEVYTVVGTTETLTFSGAAHPHEKTVSLETVFGAARDSSGRSPEYIPGVYRIKVTASTPLASELVFDAYFRMT